MEGVGSQKHRSPRVTKNGSELAHPQLASVAAQISRSGSRGRSFRQMIFSQNDEGMKTAEKLIDSLKQELAEERQKNIQLEMENDALLSKSCSASPEKEAAVLGLLAGNEDLRDELKNEVEQTVRRYEDEIAFLRQLLVRRSSKREEARERGESDKVNELDADLKWLRQNLELVRGRMDAELAQVQLSWIKPLTYGLQKALKETEATYSRYKQDTEHEIHDLKTHIERLTMDRGRARPDPESPQMDQAVKLARGLSVLQKKRAGSPGKRELAKLKQQHQRVLSNLQLEHARCVAENQELRSLLTAAQIAEAEQRARNVLNVDPVAFMQKAARAPPAYPEPRAPSGSAPRAQTSGAAVVMTSSSVVERVQSGVRANGSSGWRSASAEPLGARWHSPHGNVSTPLSSVAGAPTRMNESLSGERAESGPQQARIPRSPDARGANGKNGGQRGGDELSSPKYHKHPLSGLSGAVVLPEIT
eukprot:Rmarinus@m.26834